jgi:hypothetical protein
MRVAVVLLHSIASLVIPLAAGTFFANVGGSVLATEKTNIYYNPTSAEWIGQMACGLRRKRNGWIREIHVEEELIQKQKSDQFECVHVAAVE